MLLNFIYANMIIIHLLSPNHDRYNLFIIH